ncbi:hypothetical protein [Endozoicomonas elysicola]|uniref:hypothetical protein n=1 Tax=Endozoicomonas elysicola TaxID=305900 RepID=UPI00035FF8D6|nr:hypothetical protein [Endozoicomonas elysicola]
MLRLLIPIVFHIPALLAMFAHWSASPTLSHSVVKLPGLRLLAAAQEYEIL